MAIFCFLVYFSIPLSSIKLIRTDVAWSYCLWCWSEASLGSKVIFVAPRTPTNPVMHDTTFLCTPEDSITPILPLVLSSLVSRLWLSFFLWLACTSSLLHTNSQVWVWSNSCLVQLYQWLSNSHYGWVALFIVLWTGDSAVCLLCVLLVLSLRESLVLVVLTAAACCCQALLDAYLVSWWVANCLVTWSWPGGFDLYLLLALFWGWTVAYIYCHLTGYMLHTNPNPLSLVFMVAGFEEKKKIKIKIKILDMIV